MEPRQAEELLMSRRTWTVEEKLSLVLEMVKGQESVTSLSRCTPSDWTFSGLA